MNNKNMSNITVIGSGSWGTALAQHCANNDHNVTLWGRDEILIDEINTKHQNGHYLPAITLNNNIKGETNLSKAVDSSEIILIVTPAQTLPDMIKNIGADVLKTKTIILCAKGILIETGQMLAELFDKDQKLAVLTGPTFAREIAMGLPAAATLACTDEALGTELVQSLSSSTFRLYWSKDVVGAESVGALKNVLAIACGIVDGMGLGDNARAALITRGMAEIARFVIFKGGSQETLLGLCGLGDIVLTCASHQSRNYSLGVTLGQGIEMTNISKEIVTEGVPTALALAKQIQNNNLDMPIALGVAAIVSGKMNVKTAVDAILQRPIRTDQEGQ